MHLEAPDECGHQGDPEGKTKSIEAIDGRIIRPVYEHLKAKGEPFAMLVMPDHFTPVSILTHSREPVPFIMWSSEKALGKGCVFSEKAAAESGVFYSNPTDLAREFFSL